MKKIKTFSQFNNESLTISTNQLNSICDIADNIDWKEGEKFAFVDFNGIKNIPINITNNEENLEETL